MIRTIILFKASSLHPVEHWLNLKRTIQPLAPIRRHFASTKSDEATTTVLMVNSHDIIVDNKNQWEIKLAQHLKSARSLLEKRPGTFSSSHFVRAKQILDGFKRITAAQFLLPPQHKNNNNNNKQHEYAVPIIANVSISLIEKLVSEMAIAGNTNDARYVCDPNYHNPFFNFWKEASKIHGDKVASPHQLAYKLQSMVQQVPEFRCNIVTYAIIMDVVIQKAHPRHAPIVAEELLNFIRTQAKKQTKNKELKPDTVIYNRVLKAWSVSRLQKAPERMEWLMQQMKEEGLSPDTNSFNSMLYFWSEKGNVQKIEEILAAMKRNGVQPNRRNIAQVISCYCKVSDLDKANVFMNTFLQMEPQSHIEEQMAWDCVQRLLLKYRDTIEARDVPNWQKKSLAEQANVFFETIMENHGNMASEESKNKMIGLMMDLFCSAGCFDQVETLVQNRVLNKVLFCILLKALTKNKQIERATNIFLNALKGEETSSLNTAADVIDNHSFHSVMNGWADSSDPDAFGKTFTIYRLMTEDPRSIKLGVRPMVITYNILLKCLVKSNRPDAGKRAIEILDEVDRRYRSGDSSCRPTENTFNTAILACLQSGSGEYAESVMDRMNKVGIHPSLKTYNDILSHWAKIGTRKSAERTELIIATMKQLARSQPHLAPDTVSYNIALSAWARASCPLSAKKMWILYEQMLDEKIEPDKISMNTLICYFANTNIREIIQKAEELLISMENSTNETLSPDFRFFWPVIRGWLSIDDVDRAAATLERRVEAYIEGKGRKSGPYAVPNSISMDRIAHGFLRQGDLIKATCFLEKFKQLKDDDYLPEGPSVRTFTSLLSYWEKSNHSYKAPMIPRLQGIIASLNASSPPP